MKYRYWLTNPRGRLVGGHDLTDEQVSDLRAEGWTVTLTSGTGRA